MMVGSGLERMRQKKQFGFAVDTWIGRWFPFLWGNGGDAFDDANNPKRFTFISRQTEQTLQWLVDLPFRHQVAPQPADLHGTNIGRLFTEGRLAMRMDIQTTMGSLRPVDGLQWDVVPVPRGPSGRFTRMAGAGVGIHPASGNKPLAWEYLKFPGSAEAYELTKDTTYSLPPVRAAAEADWYLKWVPADVRKVWVETFEYGRVQAHL